MSEHLFTSESVSEGHPDKVADQISDAVLDAIFQQDTKARVACETMVKTGVAIVAGEITTSAYVDIPKIARETINGIGYDNAIYGFDGNTCAVLLALDKQSQDIAQGVNSGEGIDLDQGAGTGLAHVAVDPVDQFAGTDARGERHPAAVDVAALAARQIEPMGGSPDRKLGGKPLREHCACRKLQSQTRFHIEPVSGIADLLAVGGGGQVEGSAAKTPVRILGDGRTGCPNEE